jgi:2,3-bisphosphoglycerate-dependent phosphoglycerate mutase
MRFYFIRHAQSHNNALFDATGAELGRSDDPELSSLGVKQAVALGDFLTRNTDPLESGQRFTHLYCSTMTRAIHTALEVSRGTGLTPIIWEEWHETGGIWLEQNGERIGQTGKNRVELEARFPNMDFSMYGEEGWWSRATELDCSPRAENAWKTLLERHGGTKDRVAIVSHGYFYAHIMGQALGVAVGSGKHWFQLNNTGITRIDIDETLYLSTEVKYANRLAHLPLEQIS